MIQSVLIRIVDLHLLVTKRVIHRCVATIQGGMSGVIAAHRVMEVIRHEYRIVFAPTLTHPRLTNHVATYHSANNKSNLVTHKTVANTMAGQTGQNVLRHVEQDGNHEMRCVIVQLMALQPFPILQYVLNTDLYPPKIARVIHNLVVNMRVSVNGHPVPLNVTAEHEREHSNVCVLILTDQLIMCRVPSSGYLKLACKMKRVIQILVVFTRDLLNGRNVRKHAEEEYKSDRIHVFVLQ